MHGVLPRSHLPFSSPPAAGGAASTMRATHLLPALLLHQLLLLPTAIPAAGQFFYHFASDPPPASHPQHIPSPPRQGGCWGAAAQFAGRSPGRSCRWGWLAAPRPAWPGGEAAPVPPRARGAEPGVAQGEAVGTRRAPAAQPHGRGRSRLAACAAGLARDGQTWNPGRKGKEISSLPRGAPGRCQDRTVCL